MLYTIKDLDDASWKRPRSTIITYLYQGEVWYRYAGESHYRYKFGTVEYVLAYIHKNNWQKIDPKSNLSDICNRIHSRHLKVKR